MSTQNGLALYDQFYEQLTHQRLADGECRDVRVGIGTILRRERLKQGLKLINVCRDLCSVSYYSRIERNEVMPDQDLLQALFERLKIPFQASIIVNHTEQQDTLDQFFQHLAYGRNEELNQFLKEKKGDVPLFHIMTLIHALADGNLNKGEECLKRVYIYRDLLTNLELAGLLYGTAQYYFKMDHYRQAKNYIDLAFKIECQLPILKGYLHYLYAKVLSRLNQSLLAIEHIEKAQTIFSSLYINCFVLRSQLFMAIEWSKRYPYKAKKQLNSLLQSSDIKSYPRYEHICRLHLALIEMRLQNYHDSFKQLAYLLQKVDDDPLVEMVYAYLLIEAGRKDKVKHHLKEMKKMPLQSQRLKHMMLYLQSLANDDSPKKRIDLLEKTLIPTAIQAQDEVLEWEWRIRAIKLYEDQASYQEATRHYRELIKKVCPLTTI
ncbi:MAG TPA: helix-turn-helix transcriptional regulator [Haloplasmataceae bacterium]